MKVLTLHRIDPEAERRVLGVWVTREWSLESESRSEVGALLLSMTALLKRTFMSVRVGLFGHRLYFAECVCCISVELSVSMGDCCEDL